MTELDGVALVARWLHLAAAIVAVGGTVFMRFILGPAAARVLPPGDHDQLRGAVIGRWRWVVHGAIGILILSGGVNLARAVGRGPIQGAYLVVFGAKLMAVLALFFIASALVGRSPAFAPLRAAPRPWLTAAVVLGALIVALSGVLHGVTAAAGPATGGG